MNREKNICHVIKDPVHGAMQFSGTEYDWIKPFIDSPGLQRLRHIKQMGMSDYIFPGAVHTRFNHSLGCCYIASQIAHRIGLNEEERQIVMIAGLLHDIGHGPFSHAFEDLFHDRLIRHEAWTPLFLAEYRSGKENFSQMEDMIMHRASGRQVLADIVSSQLDADRLDYLLRDSHFCGVSYGEFDFRWLLNSMTVVQTKTGERLGITWKGVGTVEHYLMARRLMTRNLCHHPKKLALEFYLVQLLSMLAQSPTDTFPFSDIHASRIGKFLQAVNQFNTSAKKTNVPAALQTLCADFLKENYTNYRTLCDYDVFAVIRELAESDSKHPAVRLARRIQHRRMPLIVPLELANIPVAETLVAEYQQKYAAETESWQFALIKSPHQSYTVCEDPILVETRQGQVKSLDALSLMIRAISDRAEHSAFLSIDTEKANDPRILQVIRELSPEIPVDYVAGSLS